MLRKMSAWVKTLNLTNTAFLILSPLIVFTFIPLHILSRGWSWGLFCLFIAFCLITSLSVTGGYHRLFAHRSYDASPFFKFFYLIFGAAALQGSALKWSTDHRRHHRFVDTDADPYSIKKGFLFAHMGWVFFKEDPQYADKFVPDLEADPLVKWQHKYYAPLAIGLGFAAPTLVGIALGSPIGGLLWGGFARIVVTHHCTFFINSLCHFWGSRPYGDRTSARDNFIMAFFTYGEGYHNFHHRFQADYRNGIRWYQWDPTKWLIWSASRMGLTWNLKTAQEGEILKARIVADEKRLIDRGLCCERVAAMKQKLEHAQEQMRILHQKYIDIKKNWQESKEHHMQSLRTEIKLAKVEFRSALRQWRLFVRFAVNQKAHE